MSIMLVNSFTYGLASTPIQVEYRGSVSQNVSSPVSLSLGADDPGRYILVAVHTTSLVLPTSATIAGVTADIHIATSVTLVGPRDFGVYVVGALVPTGSTGSLVLNFSGGGPGICRIETYRLVGMDSNVPVDTDIQSASSIITISATVDAEKDGAVFGFASLFSASPTDFTAGVTSDYQTALSGTNNYAAGGHAEITADELGRTVTYSRTSGGTTFIVLLAAISFK